MTKAQAGNAIQRVIDMDYKNPHEQGRVIDEGQQALAFLTMTTDAQTTASDALRTFIYRVEENSPENPRPNVNEALAALDTLSGESSQESLRASLEDELTDAMTNVLETHGANETVILDKATEAIRSIVTRIENRNLRLDPETF